MLVRVLGSAAGGGFPQWNCGCPNCRGVRAGAIRATLPNPGVGRGQRGRRRLVPRQRLAGDPGPDRELPADPPARRRATRRSRASCSPTATSTTASGCSRSASPIPSSCTRPSRSTAASREGNVLFRTLQRFPEQVTWRRPRSSDARTRSRGAGGRPSGLLDRAGPASRASRPIHLEGRHAPDPEESIGLRIREAAHRPRAGLLLGRGGAHAGRARRPLERRGLPCSSTARSGRATS